MKADKSATGVLETSERARLLAASLDCVTESDFIELCGITAGTAEAWRRRHKGPDYAQVGNRVLYPLAKVREFIDSEVRTLRRVPPKAVL